MNNAAIRRRAPAIARPRESAERSMSSMVTTDL
jgi:hypothetical protein